MNLSFRRILWWWFALSWLNFNWWILDFNFRLAENLIFLRIFIWICIVMGSLLNMSTIPFLWLLSNFSLIFRWISSPLCNWLKTFPLIYWLRIFLIFRRVSTPLIFCWLWNFILVYILKFKLFFSWILTLI